MGSVVFNSIVIVGVALGIIQLLAGVSLGLWFAHMRKRRGLLRSLVPRDLERLAAGLLELKENVSESVRRHSSELEQTESRLETEVQKVGLNASDHPVANLVVGVVGDLLAVNDRLKDDLDAAEREIQTQAEELAEQVQISMTDALTGLPNRRALEEQIRANAERLRRHHAPFSVAIFDVDHFKQFNDTHGHPAGDRALKEVARSLRGVLREYDFVARYGGEEFAVLLPHTTLEPACAAVNKLMRGVCATRVEVEGQWTPLTTSAGLAASQPREAIERLIERADEALYAAKENGRQQAFLHDGRQVRAIEGSQVTPGEWVAESPDLGVAEEELRQVCNDLRSRLATFMQDKSPDSVESPRKAK